MVPQLIDQFLQHAPEGELLDLGAGDGRVATLLSGRGRHVHAVERDSKRVAQIRERSARAEGRITFEEADVRSVEIPAGRYAGILLLNVVQYLKPSEMRGLVRRACEGVVPGGVVLIITFSPEDPGHAQLVVSGCPLEGEPHTFSGSSGEVTSFYSVADLRKAVGAFSVAFEQEAMLLDEHPPTGRHLHGVSAVLAQRPMAEAQAKSDAPSRCIPGPSPQVFPTVGVGLALRRQFSAELLKQAPRVDVIEASTDEFLTEAGNAQLVAWGKHCRVVLHAVSLNIGGVAPAQEDLLTDLGRTVKASGAPWHSDHLCFSASDTTDTAGLVPLPATEEAIDVIRRNVLRLKQYTAAPFLLENIAYIFDWPRGEMDEATFIRRALDAADAGLLLDVCNVVLNAANHGYDPVDFISRLPLDRVVQLHLAGGRYFGKIYVDTHGERIADATWRVYEEVLKRAPVQCVIIERDARLPPLEELLSEVERAQTLFRKHRGAVPQ